MKCHPTARTLLYLWTSFVRLHFGYIYACIYIHIFACPFVFSVWVGAAAGARGEPGVAHRADAEDSERVVEGSLRRRDRPLRQGALACELAFKYFSGLPVAPRYYILWRHFLLPCICRSGRGGYWLHLGKEEDRCIFCVVVSFSPHVCVFGSCIYVGMICMLRSRHHRGREASRNGSMVPEIMCTSGRGRFF